ncbi:MAG TPA: ankyrin repeat domain-containing protein [Luteimonas sp.]|nr:ankyrin repeat domain-containing protein [Luteimonas sp.]
MEDWLENCGGWSPRLDLDELRRGIQTGLVNKQDEYGTTALHAAVSSGWLEGIEELLRAGADTELRYFRTGATPLLTATSDLGTGNGERLNSKGMVAALLKAGANPDAANHFGETPRKIANFRESEVFDHVPEQPVQMPEPRIQNAEHLADHHPRFKIPDREERETMQVGQAVVLYVYGPNTGDKQEKVKVRITASDGARPHVRYKATVEMPIEHTHLPPNTTELEFAPENIASVYVPRSTKRKV